MIIFGVRNSTKIQYIQIIMITFSTFGLKWGGYPLPRRSRTRLFAQKWTFQLEIKYPSKSERITLKIKKVRAFSNLRSKFFKTEKTHVYAGRADFKVSPPSVYVVQKKTPFFFEMLYLHENVIFFYDFFLNHIYLWRSLDSRGFLALRDRIKC